MDKNLFNFLKSKPEFQGLNTMSTKKQVLSLLGPAKEIVGSNEMGFLYYEGGFRFAYTDLRITEIGIDFNQLGVDFTLKDTNNELIGKINSNTLIHEFLDMLNDALIKWEPFEMVGNHYVGFQTESKARVIFSVYEGKIEKILF